MAYGLLMRVLELCQTSVCTCIYALFPSVFCVYGYIIATCMVHLSIVIVLGTGVIAAVP